MVHTGTVNTMLALAARSASGVSNGFNVGEFTEALVMVDVTAVSGTAPTLDIKVQISHNNTDWWDHTTFTQIVAVGKAYKSLTAFGKYMRLSYTIGGTSPQFTFGAYLVTK